MKIYSAPLAKWSFSRYRSRYNASMTTSPPLIILKIGGSVATHKDRAGLAIRTALLKKIALAIRAARDERPLRLILIHGSGSAGHQLAHDFDLRHGTGTDPLKIDAALRSQRANQSLDAAIAEILVAAGLPVVPVHTASVIIQRDAKIHRFATDAVARALKHGQIPLLYGEMVPDTRLGFSVCSGDTIAVALAREFGADRIGFASDIDGVFTRDPHRFADATLIETTHISSLADRSDLSGSHNIDVTGGLGGKIEKLAPLRRSSIRQVEIFNGLHPAHYRHILLSVPFPHTTLLFGQKKRG